MSARNFFLAWQDKVETRQLVGRAHVEPDKPPLALPVNPSEALAEDWTDRL